MPGLGFVAPLFPPAYLELGETYILLEVVLVILDDLAAGLTLIGA